MADTSYSALVQHPTTKESKSKTETPQTVSLLIQLAGALPLTHALHTTESVSTLYALIYFKLQSIYLQLPSPGPNAESPAVSAPAQRRDGLSLTV